MVQIQAPEPSEDHAQLSEAANRLDMWVAANSLLRASHREAEPFDVLQLAKWLNGEESVL